MLLLWMSLWAAPPAVFDELRVTADLPRAERVERLSRLFLGDRYLLGGLGEGEGAPYDADPLFRFDAFDCTTYVETVLALARSRAPDEFAATLSRVRYQGGEISFVTRNHFPDADWIPNGEHEGFIRDVTRELAPRGFALARTVIDRREWYAKLGPGAIQVPGLSDGERAARLRELRALGERFSPETVELPYLPTELLLAHPETLDGLAGEAAVIDVVRPGGVTNISHQGLLLRAQGRWVVRHASPLGAARVIEQPLEVFLRGLLGSATIRGVNLLAVL